MTDLNFEASIANDAPLMSTSDSPPRLTPESFTCGVVRVRRFGSLCSGSSTLDSHRDERNF